MDRTFPTVQLVCAVCNAPVDQACDVVEWSIPGTTNREAEGLCSECMAWVVRCVLGE